MKKIIVCLMIIMTVVSGCSQKPPDAVEAYTVVIDKLYNEDMALNADIKYIAVDTSSIVNLSNEKKERLLKEVGKYGLNVLDMTFDELEKEGYIKDLYFEQGILFKIEDKEMNNNSIMMDVSKWRSGTGAVGYENLKTKYKDGNWEITDTGSAWIS